METLTAWVFLAFVVEEAVRIVKKIFPKLQEIRISYVEIPLLITLGFSLIITFGANLDFFEMMNIEFDLAFVGPALSALLMTGGSEVVQNIKDKLQS